MHSVCKQSQMKQLAGPLALPFRDASLASPIHTWPHDLEDILFALSWWVQLLPAGRPRPPLVNVSLTAEWETGPARVCPDHPRPIASPIPPCTTVPQSTSSLPLPLPPPTSLRHSASISRGIVEHGLYGNEPRLPVSALPWSGSPDTPVAANHSAQRLEPSAS